MHRFSVIRHTDESSIERQVCYISTNQRINLIIFSFHQKRDGLMPFKNMLITRHITFGASINVPILMITVNLLRRLLIQT